MAASASATAGYRAPSNVKPAVLVLALAALIPSILAYRVAAAPGGIHDLRVSRTLVAVLLWLAQLWYHTIPFFTSPLRGLPRPGGVNFITGGALALLKRPPHKGINKIVRETPNNGIILVRGAVHPTGALIVTSPAALSDVLNTHSYDWEKPAIGRKFLSRVLGTGLVVAEGKEHKWQRKNVAPAFQGKQIRALVPLFWRKATQMVNVISEGGVTTARPSYEIPSDIPAPRINAQGKHVLHVEIGTMASRATLDIIGLAGFGRDFNTLVNNDDELAKNYEIVLDPKKKYLMLFAAVSLVRATLIQINALLPQWLVQYIPWEQNRRINRSIKSMHAICRQLVSERRADVLAEKANGATPSIDILSVMMRNNDIDEEGLANQMLTMLAAGHETTSSALTWCTYLISKNPEVQTKLRAELKASPLANSSAALSADDLDALPYLQAVCAETLRVYPTVPTTGRWAVRDTQILDTFVPKGTQVVLSPWAINRSLELWGPDADEFRPERWLEGGNKADAMGNYEFLTFLHGPRSCIGQGFARSELKCLVAALILKYELALARPNEEPRPSGIVAIRPLDGMWLRLTEL